MKIYLVIITYFFLCSFTIFAQNDRIILPAFYTNLSNGANNISLISGGGLAISDVSINNNNYIFSGFYALQKHTSKITSAEEHKSIPNTFTLYQNYPNPFNPSTKIDFIIPITGANDKEIVRLEVFDVLGRKVSTLLNETKKAGSYQVNFDATNLSSGVYFYRLQFGEYSDTKKMILLR